MNSVPRNSRQTPDDYAPGQALRATKHRALAARRGQPARWTQWAASLTALCFIWSFAVAPVALATQAARKAAPRRAVKAHPMTAAELQRRAVQAKAAARKHLAKTLTGPRRPGLPNLAEFVRRQAAAHPERLKAPAAPARPVAASPSLLDEVGKLARPVAPATVAAWKAEIRTTHPAAARAAALHLWLGEYALAHDEQPHGARWHFRQAQALTNRRDPLYGLAAYDGAMALFMEGAYGEATDSFRRLQDVRTALPGYDRRRCALWLRHASACAGYHAEHAALGIPEPPRLDPLCAAAALAACLRSLGRPYDKATVLKACRVTGEGSNLADVAAAGPKLGVSVRAVSATEEGLRNLPLPVVAHVERDHFVAVVRADKKGVSYLCSDCGAWPGGRVDLTWRQWRTMNAGVYAAVTLPGSPADRQLAALRSGSDQAASGLAPVRLAMALGDLLPGLSRPLTPVLPAPSHLRGVTLMTDAGTYYECATKITTLPCVECLTCCLWDGLGMGITPGGTFAFARVGPSVGDPVNLATGEEQYTPPADLTVYNPHGPSVSWGRVYVSLGGASLGDQDFGSGWSHTYNVGVQQNSVIFDNGAKVPFTVPTAPTSSAPHVDCTTQPGVPFLVEADYDAATAGTYYTITFKDRTRWVTSPGNGYYSSPLAEIVDRNGNAIRFNYDTTNSQPRLSSITDASTGTKLLTVLRGPGGSIAAVTDCYGREVYYHVGYYGSHTDNPYELDWVSQIVPACTPNPPARYVLGYQALPTLSQSGGVAQFLHTITVPSPTGNGTSTATINYNAGTEMVTSLVDANGNTRSYTSVDGAGSATNAPSNSTRVTVSDAQGHTVYSYVGSFDNNMSKTAVTDGAGNVTSREVYSDPQNPYRPSLVLDGNACQAHPDAVVVQGGAGSVSPTGNDYPAAGNTWDVLDPSGAVIATSSAPAGWGATRDPNGSAVRVTAPGSAPLGNGYRVRYAAYYLGSGPFDVVSGNANYGTTRYVWDRYGNLHQSVSPRGTVTNHTWRFAGTAQSVVNSQGGGDFALGEMVEEQEGSRTSTTYAYDDTDGYLDATGAFQPCGLLQSVSTPTPGTQGTGSRVTTSYTYDVTGRGQQPMGNLGLGNVLAVTAPGNNAAAGITTTFNYTSDPAWTAPNGVSYPAYAQVAAMGLPLTVTDNLGKTSHVRYDARGNATAALDALGNETDAQYNIADQPVATALPATGQTGTGHASQTTSYLYPGGPALASAAFDESGVQVRQVSTAYGLEGETLSVTGSTEPVASAYDALYRAVSLTDGNGHVTRYAYSAQGYLATASYPGAGGATSGSDTINYTSYDADGHVLQRVDGRGIVTNYIYNDPESALTAVQYPVSASLNISLGYDAFGRRSAMTDGVGTQTYTYDDTDAPLSVNTTYMGLSAQMVSYGYWPDGSRQSMGTPAGAFSYQYDADGRMTGLTNPFGETSGWQYLDNGWLDIQALGNGATTAYTYNPLGQLSSLTNRTAGGIGLSDFGSMAYDGAGNRTALTTNLPAAPAGYSGNTAYAYDSKDQLTQEQSTRAGGYTNGFGYDSAGNPTTFRGASRAFNADNQSSGNTYDGNGNPTSYGGSALTFDPENRATSFGSALTAGYTGEGLRAWKQSSAGKTYFLYDGDVPVCEMDSSGNVSAVNTFGADGLLSRRSGGTSAFYTFDPSGNVAQRLDGAGGVLSSDTYDAFGSGGSTGSGSDVFGFGGQWGYQTDTDTGLVLCTHRYYDPSNGRWLTRDPIDYDGGINLYGYCGNNPVNWTDPTGTQQVTTPSLPPSPPGPPGPGIRVSPGVGRVIIGIGRITSGAIRFAGSAAGTVVAGIGLFFLATGPAGPADEWGGRGQPCYNMGSLQSNEYVEQVKKEVPGAKFGDPATCKWFKDKLAATTDPALKLKIIAARKYMGCDGKPRGAGGRN